MTIRQYRDNEREKHIRKFTVKKLLTSHVIMYDGDILVRIRKPTRRGGAKATQLHDLPEGFIDHLIKHIAEVCVGRYTAVWDLQAVFGAPKGVATPLVEDPAP